MTTRRSLTGLLSSEPQPGWRGRLLQLGRVRGVLLITAFSVVVSLIVTTAVNYLLGLMDTLAVDLMIATVVPLIVAPIASGAAMGLLMEIEKARAALLEVAVRDALTPLYNRRYFSARLDEEVQRARRQASAVALVLVDIDHFKRINDTHGHAVGDTVLQRVAELLKAQARPYDVAARFGGDEFVLMLPGSSAAEGVAVAERVCELVRTLRTDSADAGKPLQVTVSVGVAVLGRLPDDSDALLRRADEAMYEAKRGGRNCAAMREGAW